MKVLGFIVLFAVCVAAQTSAVLTGKANWTSTNIESAKIILVSRSSPTIRFEQLTDKNGVFRFENIPVGRYKITAIGQCIEPVPLCSPRPVAEGSVDVTAGGDNQVELTLEYRRIEETVEIAANDDQPISEISKTVNVITGQEMRDRADFTLVDTLRTVPGFRVQQLGGFGRTASIKARGLRNQDTAVLVDGVRFRDPGSITGDATPFLSDFTLTSVDRIEVLRGSGSSLYGTNAIGGTIDFQTPQPRDGFHGQLSGAAGGLGLGRFRSNLSYGTRSFGISGAVSRTAYTKGIDGEDNAGNTNFQSRVDYRPGSNTQISGRFFVSDANVRLNTSPTTFGTLPPTGIIDAVAGVNFLPDRNDPDSVQDSRFFTGQLHATRSFNTRFVVSGFYQGLDADRTNNDGLLGPGFQGEFTSSLGGTIHTANVHAKWIPNTSNTFTAGYEFEAERFRNSGSSAGGIDAFSTRAGQRSNTLYVQHMTGLLDDRLQLVGGFRAQWFSLDEPEFSVTTGPYANLTLSDPPAAYTFDGAASYYISKTGTKLRMHAGSGYRVPSLYERFGTFFFFNEFFPQGNPGLEPERSVGIDAGIDQYFAKEKVKATATYFYTRIKDEITYLPTDDFSAPVYYNFDRHFSRGVEFSVDLRPTRSTDIFASYTFTNSDIRRFSRPTLTTVTSADSRSFAIPDHQFTLVVTQRIQRFWASLDLLATSSYLAPVGFPSRVYRFEGNRRADLTAGYTIPIREEKYSVRLFGTIENLFDNQYFEHGFRTVGRNARMGVSFAF